MTTKLVKKTTSKAGVSPLVGFHFTPRDTRINADAVGLKRNRKQKGPVSGSVAVGDSKFSIEDLIKQVLGAKVLRPVDTLVDDSAMPEAPNYVEFMTAPHFMDTDIWARQAEVGLKLFGEWCPNPKCTDLEWFNGGPPGKLSVPKKASIATLRRRVSILEHDTCPKCGASKAEHLISGRIPFYDELAGVAGQRASKSTMVAMMSTYITHRYLKLQNPVKVLGLLKATILHGTFVALTFKQAQETLWDPFYSFVSNSPWFREYHKLLDRVGHELGEELYKLKDTFLLYRHRNLLLYPSGPNKKTLRGRTRFLAGIDELGWFNHDLEQMTSKGVKSDGNEIYIALERSLLTVREASRALLKSEKVSVIPGIFANVSSPSSRNDKIMSLHRESLTSSHIFAFQHPTWEINPKIDRNSPVITSEYRKNPLAADRDYGANPPLSTNPFFDSIDIISKAQKLRNCVKVSQGVMKRPDGSRFSYGTITKVTEDGHGCILALDAGLTSNSFAMALVRPKPNKPGACQVVGVCEIIPKSGYPINHNKVFENLILPLVKARNVRVIVADRWQSVKVLHDTVAAYPHVKQEQYSLKYEDMVLVKDNLLDGNVELPLLEATTKIEDILDYDASTYPAFVVGKPVSHLLLQMLSVQDTKSDVVKGDITDDLWRAVALGCTYALDPEIAKLVSSAAVTNRVRTLGFVSTRSGGSNGSSGGSGGGGGGSSVSVFSGRSGGSR